jgi:hypothetical protein
MKLRSTLAGVTAAVVTSSSAAAADCAGVFLYRPNDRLTIQELSGIGGSESAEGPADKVLVAQWTDWENAAWRGDWSLLAVIYGSEIGTGGRVAGGTLWVKDREAFGTGGGGRFRTAKDGVYLTIRPVTPIKGCQAGYTFRLDARGVLYANGAVVGRAKPAD